MFESVEKLFQCQGDSDTIRCSACPKVLWELPIRMPRCGHRTKKEVMVNLFFTSLLGFEELVVSSGEHAVTGIDPECHSRCQHSSTGTAPGLKAAWSLRELCKHRSPVPDQQRSYLSFSSFLSGVWSMVSFIAFPFRHKIARLSPTLATTSSMPSRNKATVAVVPEVRRVAGM